MGGGRASVHRARAGRAAHPIHGSQKAARLFVKVFERFHAGTEIGHAWLNHGPAVVIRTSAGRKVVYLFECDEEERITGVYAVLNPEKLAYIA